MMAKRIDVAQGAYRTPTPSPVPPETGPGPPTAPLLAPSMPPMVDPAIPDPPVPFVIMPPPLNIPARPPGATWVLPLVAPVDKPLDPGPELPVPPPMLPEVAPGPTAPPLAVPSVTGGPLFARGAVMGAVPCAATGVRAAMKGSMAKVAATSRIGPALPDMRLAVVRLTPVPSEAVEGVSMRTVPAGVAWPQLAVIGSLGSDMQVLHVSAGHNAADGGAAARHAVMGP